MPRFLPPEAAYWSAVIDFLRARHERLREDPDKGAMSAEAMIIIAALALVAITAMGVVTAKIIEKANQIKL
ncbi:hypothetical protein [Streptosporangium sp. NPDC051022]|uniref:hypothetical protein n=1 Tax=Streptosporangium sp. NPDC051022 TaxID=3155752 RepID=UPI003417B7F6